MNFFQKGKKSKGQTKRPARFAGTWYKNDPKALSTEIETYLADAQVKLGQTNIEPDQSFLTGIISPHAGFMYSGKTAAYAFCKVKANKASVKRVILLGPSHYTNIKGIALSKFDAYQTPLGDIPVDLDAVNSLSASSNFQFKDAVHEREHSLELQTAYIRHILGEIPMIPLVVGTFSDQTHIRQCAQEILEVKKPGDIFVVSSDFTHYGPRYDYVPFYDNISDNIKKLDFTAFSLIEQLDLDELIKFQAQTECTICGFNPICLTLATLSADNKSQLLHYETSRSQGTDDDLNSVSYLAISFQSSISHLTISKEDKDALLKLARFTALFFTKNKKKPGLKQLPPDLVLSDFVKKPMGVFVTFFLKNTEEGQEDLRGCIGYIMPMMPLYQAVIDNAIGACSKDYRFLPVQYDELSNIKIEISVLTKPEAVSSYKDIIIGKHGILMQAQGKQAVFLPHVATEYGWTLEETLTQLALKAGLKADAWQKEKVRFEVFESIMFEEEEED